MNCGPITRAGPDRFEQQQKEMEIEPLLRCIKLKLHGCRAGGTSIKIKDNELMLQKTRNFILIGAKVLRPQEKAPFVQKLEGAVQIVR